MINDVLRETEGKMKKSVEALRQHLTTIRTGRASPTLVEHMQVEAYGTPMPLNQLAGISTPDARMIVIQPYDASMIKTIGGSGRVSASTTSMRLALRTASAW